MPPLDDYLDVKIPHNIFVDTEVEVSDGYRELQWALEALMAVNGGQFNDLLNALRSFQRPPQFHSL